MELCIAAGILIRSLVYIPFISYEIKNSGHFNIVWTRRIVLVLVSFKLAPQLARVIRLCGVIIKHCELKGNIPHCRPRIP